MVCACMHALLHLGVGYVSLIPLPEVMHSVQFQVLQVSGTFEDRIASIHN